MANEQNLIPFDERTESERREISRKGGVASGAARRRKKLMREAADLFLSLPVTDKRIKNKLSKTELKEDEIDNQMAMVAGLWASAAEGDASAAKLLISILGDDKAGAGVVNEAGDDPITAALKEDAENGLL